MYSVQNSHGTYAHVEQVYSGWRQSKFFQSNHLPELTVGGDGSKSANTI